MKLLSIVLLTLVYSYSAFAQIFDVDTIQYNGSTGELINVVILGDGYTQDQLERFAGDARNAAGALFDEPPYSNYRNYFNIFMIKVPSKDSGAADNPNQLIDNYFGSTYNGYPGIERLLVPLKTSEIMNVLAYNFPEYDQVLMIVNDTRYGGSGGWIATFSTNSASQEICRHELGHSFSGLADEYWAGPQYAHEAINMTQETDTSLLIWKNWYGDYEIGLYPHDESPTWYRPHQNCKMRYLGPPYCAVCGEGTVERIHTLVSPLRSSYPTSAQVKPSAYPISFSLNLTKPLPNTLRVEWILNNARIAMNNDSIDIGAGDLLPGKNILRAVVEDTTEFLRVDSHNEIHFSVVGWTIETSVTGIGHPLIESDRFDVRMYPNPVHDNLTIQLTKEFTRSPNVHIVDVLGNIRISGSLNAQGSCTLRTEGLDAGYYVLMICSDDTILATATIVKR